MARRPLPPSLSWILAGLVLAPALACDRGAGGGAEAKTENPPAAAAAPEAEGEVSPAVAAPGGPAPTPFEDDEGNYGYRDGAGVVVVAPAYALANEFTDNVAGVCGADGCAFIDRTGTRLATPFMFDNGPDEFVEGRARIVEGPAETAKYGFIASTGEIVVAPAWSFALPFSGGYAAVCEGCVREMDGEHSRHTGGKWGYVDSKGEVAIAPKFDEAGPFADGRASVVLAGRTLQIGPDGQEVGG